MNREILFRGRRTDNGAWVEGFYATDYPNTDREMILCHDVAGEYGGLIYYSVDPSTVCRFTGLADKNGKRIFEGDIFIEDICEEIKLEKLRPGQKFVVEYSQEYARWNKRRMDSIPACENCWELNMPGYITSEKYIIIGTIHDEGGTP